MEEEQNLNAEISENKELVSAEIKPPAEVAEITASGEKVDTFAVYMELPATYGSNNIDFYSAADMWESSPTFSVEANSVDLAITDTLEAL